MTGHCATYWPIRYKNVPFVPQSVCSFLCVWSRPALAGSVVMVGGLPSSPEGRERALRFGPALATFCALLPSHSWTWWVWQRRAGMPAAGSMVGFDHQVSRQGVSRVCCRPSPDPALQAICPPRRFPAFPHRGRPLAALNTQSHHLVSPRHRRPRPPGPPPRISA